MERVQELPAAASICAGEALAVGPSASQISNSDLLRYVGDMVDELHHMCQRTGCTTLLGLLALARTEAALQQLAVASRRAG